MCNEVKRAIIALAAADESATEEERARIADALSGEYTPLRIVDAARRLHVSIPTVYAMIRAGRIERLADGRISARSIDSYLKGVAARVAT